VTKAIAAAPEEVRRCRLLDAAIATFVRFGFRKTSMEEVARAAHLSRQGLYLHFPTKEELFRAAVTRAMETGIEAASACLRDESRSLEERLLSAFEAWVGRYVGSMGADVADLKEASDALVGPIMAEHDQRFVEMVAKVIRSEGLAAAHKGTAVSARQIADTLSATARGLKYACGSPGEFGERFAIAVRIVCAPLRQRP
jgi:TetR/AcrR family transcriptional regulator, regulator of autoinduction and epiphytic fitness